MSQFTTPIDVQAKLKEIFGTENVSDVSLGNGKLTATIYGKVYQYNISTGTAGEYKPVIGDIGDLVTKDNYGDYIDLGKSVEIGKLETFVADYILEILDNKIECIKTKLVQIEGEKRRVPVNIEGSNFSLNTDYVVMAIGSHPNKKIIEKLNLKTNKWGYINVDENYKTSDEKIYAIGDIAGQKQTVAWAARSGFDCAKNILTNIEN